MTLTQTLIIIFEVIGLIGLGLIIIAFFVWLYGKIENFLFKRKIPIKLKQEVEHERVRREAKLRARIEKAEAAEQRATDRVVSPESEAVQPIPFEPVTSTASRLEQYTDRPEQVEGSSEPDDRRIKRRRLKRIE